MPFSSLNLKIKVDRITNHLPDRHTKIKPRKKGWPDDARSEVTRRYERSYLVAESSHGKHRDGASQHVTDWLNLPFLVYFIRYELQSEVAHAEKREQHPAIEAAFALIVECRAGPACRAHNRQ